MKYNLFLFDADDTLFDFQKSEMLSFAKTLAQLGIVDGVDAIFKTYRIESAKMWRLLEQGKVSMEVLKVERFRSTFVTHKIDLPPAKASELYLELLPETIVLLDYAVEICRHLSTRGEVGIITNGIGQVQKRRLRNSALAPYISFMAVSEECGFAKPDIRFFEYCVKMARTFSKQSALVVGDRIEADIQGAHNFGVDACLYNPERKPVPEAIKPKFEIAHLSELHGVLE